MLEIVALKANMKECEDRFEKAKEQMEDRRFELNSMNKVASITFEKILSATEALEFNVDECFGLDIANWTYEMMDELKKFVQNYIDYFELGNIEIKFENKHVDITIYPNI